LAELERVGDIIARKAAVDPRKRRLRLELLRNSWPSLAGERLAEHSRPTRLSRGTLIVAADGASWAAEFSAMSGMILKGIEKVLGRGAVRKVRVSARAGPERAEPGAAEDVGWGEVKGEHLEGEIGEALSTLEDEEVREALGRMVRASRSSKHSKRARG
jgi:hypothetical protein